MSIDTLAQAIISVNQVLASWSEEDLQNYAFDRLVEENKRKLKALDQAIISANQVLASWSEEDLQNYAFDRLVEETKRKFK